MAIIDINLDEVNSANAQFPRYITILNSTKRELEILRWKLDEELMNCGNMKERYKFILRQISEVEEKMNNVHNFITSALRQYKEMERISKGQAEDFL